MIPANNTKNLPTGGKVTVQLKSFTQWWRVLWIMEIFRNFFMAYDIQEGGCPNTANEHNDHNDNFTGIAEVRCNSHRKGRLNSKAEHTSKKMICIKVKFSVMDNMKTAIMQRSDPMIITAVAFRISSGWISRLKTFMNAFLSWNSIK